MTPGISSESGPAARRRFEFLPGIDPEERAGSAKPLATQGIDRLEAPGQTGTALDAIRVSAHDPIASPPVGHQ
jgi:hypothetical protein